MRYLVFCRRRNSYRLLVTAFAKLQCRGPSCILWKCNVPTLLQFTIIALTIIAIIIIIIILTTYYLTHHRRRRRRHYVLLRVYKDSQSNDSTDGVEQLFRVKKKSSRIHRQTVTDWVGLTITELKVTNSLAFLKDLSYRSFDCQPPAGK